MHVEIDREQLDQFPPEIREAIWRLYRAQQAAQQQEDMPFRGMELKPGKDRITEEEAEARARSQSDPRGLRIQPNLYEGDAPWRTE